MTINGDLGELRMMSEGALRALREHRGPAAPFGGAPYPSIVLLRQYRAEHAHCRKLLWRLDGHPEIAPVTVDARCGTCKETDVILGAEE